MQKREQSSGKQAGGIGNMSIEERMSFFWGEGKMSWLRYLTLETFCKLNPHWDIRLYFTTKSKKVQTWRSIEQQDFKHYDGACYFEKATKIKNLQSIPAEYFFPKFPTHLSPVHQCDLLQWKILAELGGWYSDMDILYLKSMELLHNRTLNDQYDMVMCLPCGDLTIGFLAAKQGRKFYRAMFNSCLQQLQEPNTYQAFGTSKMFEMCGLRGNAPGRDAVWRITKHFNHSIYVTENGEDVYPWNWRGVENIWHKDVGVGADQVGIHWYAGAPTSQKMNAVLTPENWDAPEFDSTFTYQLRRLNDNNILDLDSHSSI